MRPKYVTTSKHDAKITLLITEQFLKRVTQKTIAKFSVV